MTRLLLGAIVAGAAATVTLLLASAIAAAAWRFGARQLSGLAPRKRALFLACWRLAPAMLAMAAATLAYVAFVRFEPVNVDETVGALLPLLAAAGLVSAAAGLWRLARAWRQTTRSLRAWRAEHAGGGRALPMFALDVAYPVVAVVGIWHPRLYVARQVVERCDSSELDAIVAHEAAHVDAHDNLTRLLFVAAPVVPCVSGINAEIERAWIAAAEDAADDAARRERSATALASALTKVARLATGRAPQLCASAILSGSGVEHRVRRLLGSAPEEPHTGWPITLTGCGAAAGLLALSPQALRTVYDFAEHCVRNLP